MSGRMLGEGNGVGPVGALGQSALRAPRILVVDRDNLQRMIICRAADRAGCIPAGAANLAEAARQMQSADFDALTLDLSFGREAVNNFLNRLGALCCMSKIFLTGHRDAADWQDEAVRHATLLGLDVEEDVAAKPLDVEMLRRMLEQLRIQRALDRDAQKAVVNASQRLERRSYLDSASYTPVQSGGGG
jgi:two-component system, chemotaxis family, chemotaxis protein CheY